MRFGSVCSGIEAASVAWHPLGWQAAFVSEIEKFPCAVLAHHYPDVPNYGDMTNYQEWPDADIDVLVGGTPCQSFSVAGLRKGLDDPRGNLMLTYGAVARRYRPRWLVWENVPGVLSSNGGRDFGTFLGMLAELGYGFAYRVLDAQYIRVESHPRAVPQRRRRVFVVGCLGGWRRAAAVLFERESLLGHPAPRREAGQGSAGRAPHGFAAGVATVGAQNKVDRGDSQHLDRLVAHSLRADGFDASEDGTGRGTPIVPVAVALRGREGGGTAELSEVPSALRASQGGGDKPYALVPIAFSSKDHGADAGEVSPTLCSMGHDGSHANGGGQVAVAFASNLGTQGGDVFDDGSSPTLRVGSAIGIPSPPAIAMQSMAVRRLTPRECERLQGFPDDYTLIPEWVRASKAKIETDVFKYFLRTGCSEEEAKVMARHPDGPRYKALGNSMAVNVMSWIGQRIQMVEEITADLERSA